MFHSARLKLTVWYLIIIMFICTTFSAVIYRFLVNEVERFERMQRFRIERRLQADPSHPYPSIIITSPELLSETKHRILLTLIVINSGIILIAGGLAYFLAGRTLKPIQTMVDEQNRFISDASHELRTPLTSLKSSFEVFLRNKNQSLSEAQTLIREGICDVNTLQSLSESLLQLAQYQKSDIDRHFEKITLNKSILEAMQKTKNSAKRKSISVQFKSPDLVLEANPYAITDMITIFLDNAIKYSSKNTQISIITKKVNSDILISVKDEGIGINEHDLIHIFERFYRADTVRSKNTTSGYGLGLSIAKKLVEMHRGTINAESEPGKGTTIFVQIPMKQTG